jgi:hypothetical protein
MNMFLSVPDRKSECSFGPRFRSEMTRRDCELQQMKTLSMELCKEQKDLQTITKYSLVSGARI